MEHLWNFPFLKIAKWKSIWKSPLWNFIIARNTAFVNTKREVFAQMLRLNEKAYELNALDKFYGRKRIGMGINKMTNQNALLESSKNSNGAFLKHQFNHFFKNEQIKLDKPQK